MAHPKLVKYPYIIHFLLYGSASQASGTFGMALWFDGNVYRFSMNLKESFRLLSSHCDHTIEHEGLSL